jgi:thermitase
MQFIKIPISLKFLYLSCLMLSLMAVSLLYVVPVRAQIEQSERPAPKAIPGELIILSKDLDRIKQIAEQSGLGDLAVEEISNGLVKVSSPNLRRAGAISTRRIQTEKGAIVDQPTASLVEQLQKAGLSAEPNVRFRAFATPNDTLFRSQWHLKNTGRNDGPYLRDGIWDRDIRAESAWDITTGSSDIVVSVIDTGVDFKNPDLAGKLLPGASFVPGINSAEDDNGHGTHVAGIAGAAANNGLGVAGVCQKCSILPVKVLDSDGYGDIASVVQGIQYSINQKSRVINMSLGSSYDSSAIRQAVVDALRAGIVVVAASGNEDSSSPEYPAAVPGVISVAALTSADKLTSFSNYGDWVKISAPGENILSTFITAKNLDSRCGDRSLSPARDGFGYCSGTSMAAPVVAGVAGLVLSKNANLDGAAAGQILLSSADSVDAANPNFKGQTGSGRVNAFKALQATPAPTV